MKKLALSVIAVILLATPVMGQVPANSIDLTLDADVFPTGARALGLTSNSNIAVFYEIKNQTTNIYSLKVRLVTANGGLGKKYTLASGIDGSGLWDVTWHPDCTRFMLIYRKDGALFARVVLSTGKARGKPKKIVDYLGNSLNITWARKNKFLVYYAKGAELVGQRLRKTGKKYKGPATLAGGELIGEAYPVAADTDINGHGIVYYSLYTSLETKQITPSALITDQKLIMQDQFSLAPPVEVLKKETFKARYDAGTGNHMISWKYEVQDPPELANPPAAGTPKYAVTDESGGEVLAPATVPEDRDPFTLNYNPLAERFAMLFTWLTQETVNETTIDVTNFGLMIFMPDGTLLSPGTLIAQEKRSLTSLVSGGYGTGDTFILVWSLDTNGGPGLFGRLFY